MKIHYLLIYFFCIASAFGGFMLGNVLFRPTHPCANSKTCIADLSENIDNNSFGFFNGHKIIPPKITLASIYPSTPVLGTNVPSEKRHIYVDLSSQKLYAYEGDRKFMETYISSGKWAATPVGNFSIWEKLRATRMAGGEGADAYDLPNVPNVMYFYHDFGLHGAYWHNNFGHQMSHGCVNMRLIDAATLFDWADGPAEGYKGTAVSVCDQFIEPNTCIQKQPIN